MTLSLYVLSLKPNGFHYRACWFIYSDGDCILQIGLFFAGVGQLNLWTAQAVWDCLQIEILCQGTKEFKSDEFVQCARVLRMCNLLEQNNTQLGTVENSPPLLCMHCSVRGKNMTHIQRVLTELCCIMLDNVDHSVFWGWFLMVWQQQRVKIKHCRTILICMLLSLPDSDWISVRMTDCLPSEA